MRLRVAKYRSKTCKECDEIFTPHAPKVVHCDDCKDRYDGKLLRRAQVYGIKCKDIMEMFTGECEICLKEIHLSRSTGKPRNDSAAIDHCHDTGKIRGMICVQCNRAVGHLGDDLETLKRAVIYLEKHNASSQASSS